jgi:hypothetical protein
MALYVGQDSSPALQTLDLVYGIQAAKLHLCCRDGALRGESALLICEAEFVPLTFCPSIILKEIRRRPVDEVDDGLNCLARHGYPSLAIASAARSRTRHKLTEGARPARARTAVP